MVLADETGLKRFEEGVRRTWQYCEFFPKPANIRNLIPPPQMSDGERWSAELKDLMRRKKEGEKFYTLNDVFSEVARRILAGELKPKAPGWIEWARNYK